MKTQINKSVVLALTLVAISALCGPVAATAAEEQALSLTAARGAARATAWKVARRNQLVNSVKLKSCERRDPRTVRCLALERGSTSLRRTTCRVWIDVRAAADRATGRVSLVSCKNDRLPLLTAAQAESAMRVRTQELAGPGREILVSLYGRAGRTVVTGSGGWMYPDKTHPSELCNVMLRATLSDGEIRVTAEDLRCITPDLH